ncbi:acyclic terpene utilization AtuA family protein [Micromonospora carbonacea]|uniref:1-deoxy-D-xylulose 5-phosphate reductoisomerase n=1 Tax=Micromonospora carbonacea TaxID=47853 RepID=A0A1C4V9E6_9ACTN|nr:acyclic terpene utilization AtuA family protein [Micromonospora carbonacea]SCE80664.1 1-deoxy-D-xylulose 5-phosphate reductoisomerase [Micromonospora carbonacea]
MSRKPLRIVSPNGHLGFAPTRPDSFRAALKHDLDYLIADSGSCDIGPGPLGADTCASPRDWQYHDLELMLLASREHGIPMLIGSAGDTGSDRSVALFVDMIKEIARRHDLPEFTIGYFNSEVPVETVRRALADGTTVSGLDGRPDLTAAALDHTQRVVAVAGAAPYISLLDQGADVIIGGRSSDCAVFAAPAIRAGFPEGLSYYLGKVLECASFCAEPYAGKESVVGEITETHVDVTAMHPDQRCTPASVASHSMYERAQPYYEYVAGGTLEMSECRYEQIAEKSTRVTGPRWLPAADVTVKLEGSGFVGHRFVGFAGVRDEYTIARIDDVMAWARKQVAEQYPDGGYELHIHPFGRDAILKRYEFDTTPAHELGLVIEGVAADRDLARAVTMTATRQVFYARLPEVKGTAGSVSFLFDEVLEASPAYEWTLNHIIPITALGDVFAPRILSSRS